MAEPIRFSTDLETASMAEEAEIQAKMIEQFTKIQSITAKDYGRGVRGVHAKSHGLLEGRLEILADLPTPLAQGAFATPGVYDIILRLSTNPGDILDDSVSTPRGLAIKILDVEGERLTDAQGRTQDFVMANAPAFVAPNAGAFLKNLKLLAATTDTPQIWKKAFSAVMRGIEAVLETFGTESGAVIALGGHPETHILGETFYSQVPHRWGDYVAKVAVAPVSSELTALTKSPLNVNGKPNGLRDAVTAFFSEHGGIWEIRAQLLTNNETMPIEDASVQWPEGESPYVAIARITVVSQDTWSDEKVRKIDDGLAFSPWNGLAAHQPLGSIMRARKAVYQKSAMFRSKFNGCPIHEPTNASQ